MIDRVANLPVSSALIGRAGDVSGLLDALGDAGTHTVLISGEAGLGKSRLVGEFSRRLDREVLVLTGRCPEFGTDGVAFAPFLAVLRSLVRQLGVAALAALLPPQPALANWLPQLAVHSGGADPGADRIRLFGEVLTVIEQLAMTRPLVLVLEDLHWADDATRDLFTFLVANLADGEVLQVGTYRPGEAGPLRGLLAEVRRNPGVKAVALQPLTRHEVGRQLAALLGREPEPALITKVFDRSGGNPLFVEALGNSPEQAPVDLTDLLLSFYSGLTPHARKVLQVATVIGSRVGDDLLTAVVDLPPDALHPALRELVDRQLLLTTDTGYEFRHVLIRQAGYDNLLPAERIRLHADLVEVLRTDVTRSAELAHHATAAGDLPQALVASWHAAEVSAAAPERLRQFERILELWDRVPQAAELIDATKVVVLEQLTKAAMDSGAIDHGIAAADAALAGTDELTDPERAARLYRRRAWLRSRTGAGPGEDLARALALLPADPPSLERGEVLAQFAITRVFSGDADAAAAAAAAALDAAEQFADPELAARAHAYLGLATATRPDLAAEYPPRTTPDSPADEPVRLIESTGIDCALGHFAAARALAAPLADPRVMLDVLTWESAVLHGDGRHNATIEAVQQGMKLAYESFRFADVAPILLVKWVQALTDLGRWDQVRELVHDAELEELPQLTQAALMLCLGTIALAQGDTDSARSSAADADRLLGTGQWALPYRMRLQELRCSIALADNDQAAATRVLDEVWSLQETATTLSSNPPEAWPLVVLAAAATEPPRELRALADSLPRTSPVDAAHRAEFTAHTTNAAAHWEAAAHSWQALEQPYNESRNLLRAAESYAAEGKRDAATKLLRKSARIAATLGATPLTQAVETLAKRARIPLADAPAEPANPTPAKTYGLTPRELEVLRLVAKGLSNRALATELFISTNTAGVHVSRILTKLGVATRTEATAFAHDHHLLASDRGRG